MNENVKLAMKKRAEKVISALERNNMKGYLVDTPDEAKELISLGDRVYICSSPAELCGGKFTVT